MVWEVAGRRGHVAQGPAVRHPWASLEDMNAVTGWLLWSHRMASRFGGMTGRAFAQAARQRGIPLSETEVSRAEKGERDVAISAIAKYEQVLGMPVGTLSAPLRSAARVAIRAPGSDRLATLRTVPRSAAARQQLVDAFYVRFQDGDRFTGTEWLNLVDAITVGNDSLLPNPVAAQWIRALLDEGMRSVCAAYFARIEALSTIAEHDQHAAHLLAAVRELSAAPGASGTIDAWSVVGDIRRREVIAALVSELPSVPDGELLQHAVALVTPTQRGDLRPDQLEAIAADLDRRLSAWSFGSYEPIATLAAELPSELGDPILQRIDREVHPLARLTGHRDGRDVTREVADYTRAAMDRTWPGHPSGSVLPELLRLILTSEAFGVRHHAANLIFCSPFSAAICDAAADVCTTGTDPVTRQLAIYLVSRLAVAANDEHLRMLLKRSDRAGVTVNTLTAMAHAGLLTPQDDLTPYLLDPACRYTAIYAAGITNHPDLHSSEADSEWATWWRRKKGGVWQ